MDIQSIHNSQSMSSNEYDSNLKDVDYELKMWEEPPEVERKPIRDASIVSQGNRYGKYTYTIYNDRTIEITRYSGKSRSVKIPEIIDGMAVTTIGEGAFYYKNWVRNILIPEGIYYIGDRAFARCTTLTDISIPKSVKIIGENAFSNTYWFEKQNDELVIVGDGVLIAYRGKNGNVKIPETVKSISSAFYRMGRLTSLIIPGSVHYMPDYAFMFCRNMKTLIIEDDVGMVSDCAFAGCTGLEEVIIGKNVKMLGDYAFWKCSQLQSVSLGEGMEILGIGVFWICIRLTHLVIPDTIKNIGRRAFYHCINLESITIPCNATGLGFNIFQSCEKLTINCFRGSAAENYSKTEGIPYRYF